MTVLLGIDPGSRITGYGVLEQQGNQFTYVASGCIRTQGSDMPERLGQIFAGVSELIRQYQPNSFAIEQVFLAKNPDSALKLGQARGAAIVAAKQAQLDVAEYAARQIKQAVVGRGSASKDQVQQMVKYLLSLPKAPQADAADALAVALCHGHTRQSLISMAGQVKRTARGRLR